MVLAGLLVAALVLLFVSADWYFIEGKAELKRRRIAKWVREYKEQLEEESSDRAS